MGIPLGPVELKQGKWISPVSLCIYIVFAVCVSNLCFAADLPVERFERAPFSNLKLAGINDVLQDSQGFIWLATENGLMRFDGLNTIKYESSKNNSNSLI